MGRPLLRSILPAEHPVLDEGCEVVHHRANPRASWPLGPGCTLAHSHPSPLVSLTLDLEF